MCVFAFPGVVATAEQKLRELSLPELRTVALAWQQALSSVSDTSGLVKTETIIAAVPVRMYLWISLNHAPAQPEILVVTFDNF